MFDYRVISIGTLSHNPLWSEAQPLRTAHATTTLIRSKDQVILVDPSLPAPVLEARLGERAGLGAEDVTDVFLTNFRPAHRGGLERFDKARWWISEAEREAIGVNLVQQFEQQEDEQVHEILRHEIALLQRCQAAPDRLAEQVDLFPLPGYTPGMCGLLLTPAGSTVLIAGDAVATADHLEAGRVLESSYDLAQSRQSLAEAVEIADLIIPGHDNLLANPTRRMM